MVGGPGLVSSPDGPYTPWPTFLVAAVGSYGPGNHIQAPFGADLTQTVPVYCL